MSKRPPNADDLRVRQRLARQWRLFRLENSLTQVMLASRTGISLRTVRAVENEEVTPTPRVRLAFAGFAARFRGQAKVA
jgi:DNA-binding XRE family transcriptional regulator